MLIRLLPHSLLLIFLLSFPHESQSCSCIYESGGFLISTGQVLPLNAKGIPWWGEQSSIGLPPKEAFRLEQQTSTGKYSESDFRVVPLTHKYLLEESYRLALISPVEGFSAGTKYKLSYFPDADYLFEQQGVVSKKIQIIEVTVSSKKIPTGTTTKLNVFRKNQGKLSTETYQGSCAVEINAYQVGIELPLRNEFSDFQGALMYFVRLNQKYVWRPNISLCSSTLPGKTSFGIGRELLFTWCSRGLEEPVKYLPKGKYNVEMIAWLPGTSVEFSDSADVELFCRR